MLRPANQCVDEETEAQRSEVPISALHLEGMIGGPQIRTQVFWLLASFISAVPDSLLCPSGALGEHMQNVPWRGAAILDSCCGSQTVRAGGAHEHRSGPFTVLTGEHTWPTKGQGLIQSQKVSWVCLFILVFLYLKFSSLEIHFFPREVDE